MRNSIFNRIARIFKSNANDALDQIEDPVKMIKLAIVEMEDAIVKSTEALAKAMANHKTLDKKLSGFKQESEDWYTKATLALKSGDENLAKKALEKKSNLDKQITQYSTMTAQAGQTVDQLRNQLDRMKSKFDEAKSKESILIAQANSSKAQSEIASQLGGISTSGLGNFDKYEEKILAMAAEAEAKMELSEATSRIDKDFELLESNSKVENDLDAIRKKLEEDEIQKKLLEEQKKQDLLQRKFNEQAPKEQEIKQKQLDNKKDIQQIFDELNKTDNKNNIDDKFKDFFNNK
ncbi:MAG: PspA/IM30 family protein [Cytophagales bacterium]